MIIGSRSIIMYDNAQVTMILFFLNILVFINAFIIFPPYTNHILHITSYLSIFQHNNLNILLIIFKCINITVILLKNKK